MKKSFKINYSVNFVVVNYIVNGHVRTFRFVLLFIFTQIHSTVDHEVLGKVVKSLTFHFLPYCSIKKQTNLENELNLCRPTDGLNLNEGYCCNHQHYIITFIIIATVLHKRF